MVSIIIINYNTFQLTCNCIRSIQETVKGPYEIILIENNSKEGDPQQFLDLFPAINLIILKENVGFGRANNIGMAAAKGDFMLLLNSDTIVHAKAVDEPVEYLLAHPEIDILGCKSLYPDGNTQLTTFDYRNELQLSTAIAIFIKANAIVSWLVWFLKYRNRQPAIAQVTDQVTDAPVILTPNKAHGQEIGSLVGVYLLFRKELFLETGGFDPDFFMYFEETEWFVHRLKSYTKLYYPLVSITHFTGQSDVYNKMSLQYLVSMYLYWYKISYAHYLAFCLINVFQIPSLLLMSLFTWKVHYFKTCQLQMKALPYALFDIPKYRNRFGGRPDMLKLHSLRKKNL